LTGHFKTNLLSDFSQIMRIREEVFLLSAFFTEHWAEIMLALVTAGALGICKYFISKIKNYKALLGEK
jgi:hypothetical protein